MLGRLTPLEADVLRMLCAGCTDEEAGDRLGITPASVRHHARAIQVGLQERSIATLCRRLASASTGRPAKRR
jgi:DNA-binding CsgD family transcriptional regulator